MYFHISIFSYFDNIIIQGVEGQSGLPGPTGPDGPRVSTYFRGLFLLLADPKGQHVFSSSLEFIICSEGLSMFLIKKIILN